MTSIKALLARARPRDLYLYGDESGTFSTERFFVLGVLRTRDPRRHEQEVYRLRGEHGFHSELKFSSTNKTRLPYALALLDYFWHESDLSFKAMVVNNKYLDLKRFERLGTPIRGEDVAYNYFYKRLLRAACHPRDRLIVHLDQRTRAKGDNLPQYLEEELDELKSLHLVDSKKHQLVQLADVLTGAVFADQVGTEHPAKLPIVEKMRLLMGMRSLADNDPRWESKFDVWRFRLRGT